MTEKTVKNEDRRVRRTKKLFVQGLTQLMRKKQLKDITVRELTDLVDVNRGTFYIHYRDIFDMLDKIERELFEEFDRILLSHKDESVLGNTRAFMADLFAFVSEHRDMCRVLLSENGDMSFLQKLNEVVRDKCHADWESARKNADEKEFDYVYAYGVFGCIGVLRTWLERDCVEPPEELTSLAAGMLLRGVDATV